MEEDIRDIEVSETVYRAATAFDTLVEARASCWLK